MSNLTPQSSREPWKAPVKVEELFPKITGHHFSSLNSARAGARIIQDLPVGTATLQLYSHNTPNGQKVGILLEELGVDYDAHVISTSAGEQFTSGFVAVNPNSKIPALVDTKGSKGVPVNLFESASIMVYLAEKYGAFLPSDTDLRAQVFNWLFWQMSGLGPTSGSFGHFFMFAVPDAHEARDYGTARYGMEMQRLFDVLDKHLEGRTYIVGEEITIADFCCFPLLHSMQKYPAAVELLSLDRYRNMKAWVDRIALRPAVQRGITVCSNGVGKPWLQQQKEDSV